MRETDTADKKPYFIIQSIPSPKAEPFKQWLAKVGYERMQEIADPSKVWTEQGKIGKNWEKRKWIQQRMSGQETRNKLTDYWKQSGVENQMSLLFHKHHPSGMDRYERETAQNLKGLKTQNLRDHMVKLNLSLQH